MKDYNIILFDLDGTLTDSGDGIMNSVAYAIEKMGLATLSRAELKRFVGPPLATSFRVYCGLDDKGAETAVNTYREYFAVKGIFENSVYEGIPEVLDALRKSGKKIVLATSKPEVYAIQILEHFDLMKYFDFVAGALMDETRTKKELVIEHILKSISVTEKDSVLMVGDREYDVKGAKHFGFDSLGVLYGYGDRAELEEAGATYIAENVSDILKFIV